LNRNPIQNRNLKPTQTARTRLTVDWAVDRLHAAVDRRSTASPIGLCRTLGSINRAVDRLQYSSYNTSDQSTERSTSCSFLSNVHARAHAVNRLASSELFLMSFPLIFSPTILHFSENFQPESNTTNCQLQLSNWLHH